MDKEKLTNAVFIGILAARRLKKDKRFNEFEPLIPVTVERVATSADPKYITITAVSAEGDDVYGLAFTKETAKETADCFYGLIKRIEDEEENK